MNLFIDTHLNDIVIILHQNGKIIKEKIIKEKKEHSRLIMPTIKEILDNKIPESIIVVNGPGSFTGVRLGVTIAKTLAYTMDVPIRTITSLECIAISTMEDLKIVGFNDNNGYYVGVFDDAYNLIGNLDYLSNSEFEEYSKKYKVVLEKFLNYERIINYALTKETLNPHEVNPIYVKKLDVEK